MSWGLTNPCYNCKKKEDCKDAQHIQDAIYAIHQDMEGHKGAGSVVMSCNKCQSNS